MGAGPEEGLAALLREHWRRQLGERAENSPARLEAAPAAGASDSERASPRSRPQKHDLN